MTAESVRLGLSPPLSGLVAMYGPEISRAGQIACQEVNEAGGVLGRPLELVIEDDGSLPESAVAAANTLVKKHRCVAIIGNLLSNSRIAVAYRVAEVLKVPYLNFSFYEGSILSHYFFHFAALPNQQIDKMIPYMRHKYGPRMFFAGNNYEWPRGSIDAAKTALLRVNGVSVGEEYCPIGVSGEDIDRLLSKVAQAAPDVFVPYFAGADQVALLTRFTQRGLKNRMAVVMGHYDEMMASKLPPEVRDGFYSSNTYFMTIDSPENQSFLRRLSAMPGVDGIWPRGNGILTNFGEGTYLCVKAFAKAANMAGSLDAEALIEALKTISLTSPQGTVLMDPETHHATVNTYLSRCQADGTFPIVEAFGAIAPVLPERYDHQRISHQATMEDDIRLQARMLEQMSEGVFLVNSQNKTVIFANAGGNTLFDHDKGGLLGKHLSGLLAGPDQAEQEDAREIIKNLEQSGQWQGEIRNRKKDGRPFWCSVKASSFTHPKHGEVWMAVFQDISERKQAEEKLRENRAMLRHILDAVPQSIFWKDKDGFYLGCNQVFAQSAGLADPEKIVGKTDFDLPWLKEEANAYRDDDFKVVRSKERKEHIIEPLQQADGSRLWVDTSKVPLLDETGNAYGVLGVFTDITDRILAEEEKEKLESQLRQAQKMEAIGTLAGGIAHDFNNILSVIFGYTELSMIEENPEIRRNNLESVRTAADRARELVRQILTFSRKMEQKKKPLQVSLIIKETLKMLRASLPTTIEIRQDIRSEALVLGEATQIQQVAMNLCTNAYQSMLETGGVLTVSLEEVELAPGECGYDGVTPGKFLDLKVSDTGCGIDPAIREKIFEPYFTTKELGKGTGLGLAVVHGIVKSHRGLIEVSGQKGAGTDIRVYLPIIDEDIVPVSVATAQSAPMGNGERIFFVDDEEQIRAMMVSILAMQDYHVTAFANGMEAWEAFQKHPDQADLVITDMTMPQMTGIKLAALILAQRPEIPIILCTGQSSIIDKENAMDLGIRAYLAKPVATNDLLEAIHTALKKR